MKFIVTEGGKIENVRILKGISEGFDADIVNELRNSTKDWTPATYNSKPVQTEMTYQIKYLDSIAR